MRALRLLTRADYWSTLSIYSIHSPPLVTMVEFRQEGRAAAALEGLRITMFYMAAKVKIAQM